MNNGTTLIIGIAVVLLVLVSIFLLVRDDDASVEITAPEILSMTDDTNNIYSDYNNLLTGNIR